MRRTVGALLFAICLSLFAGLANSPAAADQPRTPAGTPQFSDVPAASPFAPDIQWLLEEGITTGYSPTIFGFGDQVLREQMAAFLYRTAGSPPVDVTQCQAFPDVPAGSDFRTAICWLELEGITTGYASGEFGFGDQVLREQMAAFLHRAAGSPAVVVTGCLDFADVPADSDFGVAICWLKQQGITTGYTPTRYGYGDSVSREQMAAFLHRYATTHQACEQRVVKITGTLARDTYLSSRCASAYLTGETLVVPDGVTLTLGPGVIIKGRMEVRGRLVAAGSSERPVVFASPADDAWGGDTDGLLGFRWQGHALRLGEAAVVDLDHVLVTSTSYLSDAGDSPQGVFAPTNAAISITNSQLDCTLNLSGTRPIVERSQLNGHSTPPGGGPALWFQGVSDISGVAFAGPNANSFAGDTGHARSVVFQGASVPAGTEMVFTYAGGVSAFHVNRNGANLGLQVAGGLTLAPGTVVKGQFSVDSGVLLAAGTAEQPVAFTQSGDDTVGGDTDDPAIINPPLGTQDFVIELRGAARVELSRVLVASSSNVFRSYLWGPATSPTLSVTDSELQASLWLTGQRPVALRNTITTGHWVYGAMGLWRVDDLSGVGFSGPDANVFTGARPFERGVHFVGAQVAPGTELVLTATNGVSAFSFEDDTETGAAGLAVRGSLRIEPGTIMKGGIEVTAPGVLHSAGTAEAPIVFTAPGDDAFGGDTDGGRTTSFAPLSVASVTIDGGDRHQISHTLFTNAAAAVGLGEFTRLEVSDSKIINTSAAFTVATATSTAPDGSIVDGLPCASPYNSVVEVTDTWFGAQGLAGASPDPAGLGEVLVEGVEADPALAEFQTLMAGQLAAQAPGETNTRPWQLYSCTIPGDPATPIQFPVTPVLVAANTTPEWLPDITQR